MYRRRQATAVKGAGRQSSNDEHTTDKLKGERTMRSQHIAMFVLILTGAVPVLAGEHDLGKSHGHGHGRAWCPHCGEACYPTVTKGTVTKHCFDTESKPICIPKVRFPWEPGGKGKGACATPKCGRTKYVNVLIKHEYECSVCKYSWDPAGFKDSSKNDAKYLDAPAAESDNEEPAVPLPPAVEARRIPSSVEVRPVVNVTPEHEAEPSRAQIKSIFARFFN